MLDKFVGMRFYSFANSVETYEKHDEDEPLEKSDVVAIGIHPEGVDSEVCHLSLEDDHREICHKSRDNDEFGVSPWRHRKSYN